jgi:UDP-glucose 4-epimerase
MTRILITGGNGFIGSHLVDKLSALRRHRITVLDLYPRPYEALPSGVTFIQGDLGDTALLRRTLIDQGIEIVYHLAWVNIHETSVRDPVKDVEMNLYPSVGLLEACRDAGVKRVVFISSGGTVYGIPEKIPIPEGHPTNPINAYGITKLAFEKYLQMYSHLYGMQYVIFRPSVPYGPRQNPRRRQGAVTVFTYRALRGEPIVIWGDGEVTRDFFYIEDLREALVMIADLPNISNSIFNLAGNETCTLNELIGIIEETLGIEIKIKYEPSRKFDVPLIDLDIRAANEKLDWRPVTLLPEGIQRTADWLKEWLINRETKV